LADASKLFLENRKFLRFFSFFILYFGQGMLVGFFFFVLPSWQTVNGALTADVGIVLSAAGLPWAFKIVDGILIDRFTYPAMGRRRPWLIGAQLLIILCLLSAALVSPEPRDTGILIAFALALNLTVGFQDVATDALAVDVAPDTERGLVNGFMLGGQAIGAAFSIALTGFIAGNYGIASAMIALAGVTTLVCLTTFMIRERQGDRLLPWTSGTEVVHSIENQSQPAWLLVRTVVKTLRGRDNILLLIAAVLMGATGGLFRGVAPIFTSDVLGWSGDEFTNLASEGALIAGIFSLVLFGFFTQLVGPKRVMIGTFMAVGILSLLPLAFDSQFANASVFSTFFLTFTAVKMLGIIAWASIAMRLCPPGTEATQFAVYMAAASLGLAIRPALLAPLQAIAGFSAIFAMMAVVNFCGGVLVGMSRSQNISREFGITA
jgi:MFS transporter, PAT family, beta-lactamase induction signal transducer AmpG